MSSNSYSLASTEPPLKKVKVSHNIHRPSKKRAEEVSVDDAGAARAPEGGGGDAAVLAACSAGALVHNFAARAREVAVKLEHSGERPAQKGAGEEVVDRASGGGAPSGAAADGENGDGAILATLSAGAILQDEAARAREVAVKVEEGTEATEAELPSLPKPVLSPGDRVEIYWEGESDYFAGTVAGFKGGKVDVVYDDGDEGSYDMEREVWRLEGDGDDEEEEKEEEEEEEEGKEEDKEGEDRGEMVEKESTSRTKKQASESWIRCGVGGCVYKCKRNDNLKRHKASVHDMDVKWYKCDQCEFKCKDNSHLKVHKANIHGVDVEWFKCDQCEYKCKENSNLKQHKANKHGVDVKWRRCDQCDFKYKQSGSLHWHKTHAH